MTAFYDIAPMGYTIPVGASGSAPTGGSAYWWAMALTSVATSPTYSTYIPKGGTIKRAFVTMRCNANGTISSGSWSMDIYINGSYAGNIATKTGPITTGYNPLWANYSLNIPVNTGDYLQIYEQAPTAFGTSPSTCYRTGLIYIE